MLKQIMGALILAAAVARAQLPEAVIPQGVGVNIHFTTGRAHDLDLIAAAGCKFVRMDFVWQNTEPKPGVYDWTAYDELTRQLRQRGLRAIYILDYSNPNYETKVESHNALSHTPERSLSSPRHPESIAAFARWAAAAATHFRKDRVIWEIFNEPNGDFWKPKPNAAEYAALALATAKAVRKAEAHATIVAPALSAFDWKFFETVFASGVLEYLDAVTVHPYRGGSKPPETAAPDYARLRTLIDQYASKSKRHKIAILCGEWGYSSSARNISPATQGEFIVRQQLCNLLNDVPLSIWYDWKNDGQDPDENEQNFGTVTEQLAPKPAYSALREMTHELAGYKITRRLDDYGPRDFVVLFDKKHSPSKLAVWTMDAPHPAHLLLGHKGADDEDRAIELTRQPKYIDLAGAELK